MSRRKSSSGSQSDPRYGKYTWDMSNTVAVDSCGARLSELSLSTSPTETTGASGAAHYTAHWDAPMSSRVSPAHLVPSDSVANPLVIPGSPWEQPRAYWDPGQGFSLSPDSYRQLNSTAGPLSMNDNYMDPVVDSGESTRVSPSSGFPSRQSTMDEEWQPQEANKSKERKMSVGSSIQEKQKKSQRRAHHTSGLETGRKNSASMMSFGNRQPSYFPYPTEIREDDLRDLSVSSSNLALLPNDRHPYAGYPNEEEEWDMCEGV